MSKILINLTRLTQQVGVRHKDQKLDSIQIVAQGRTPVREGMTVDSRWLHSNPGVVKIVDVVDPEPAPEVAPVQEGDE